MNKCVLQVVMWVIAPAMINRGLTTTVMTVSLVLFLLQYIPKIYHSVHFLRRLQDLLGYIFGTIWWGIALNLIAYFVASHVSSYDPTYVLQIGLIYIMSCIFLD